MRSTDALPLRLDETNFDATVESGKPVLLDFSAVWCGPCRAIAPVMESLAVEYADRLQVATVDIDETPALAERYRVRSVPTVMLLADGEIRRVFVGARPAHEYREGIEDLLH